MKALTDLAESWEAKAKHWKRAASQQRGTKCHDEKARLVMKSELAAGHARELRAALEVIAAIERKNSGRRGMSPENGSGVVLGPYAGIEPTGVILDEIGLPTPPPFAAQEA